MDDVTGGHHTASLLMAMANKPSPHTGMPNEPPQHMMPSMGYGHGLASNTIMVPSLGMGGMGPPEMYHGHGHHQGVPAACFVQRRRKKNCHYCGYARDNLGPLHECPTCDNVFHRDCIGHPLSSCSKCLALCCCGTAVEGALSHKRTYQCVGKCCKACKSKERKSAKKRRPEDDDEVLPMHNPHDNVSIANSDTLNQYREEYRKFRMSAKNSEDMAPEEGGHMMVGDDDAGRLLSGLALDDDGMSAKHNNPAIFNVLPGDSRAVAKPGRNTDDLADGGVEHSAPPPPTYLITWSGAGGDHSSADLRALIYMVMSAPAGCLSSLQLDALVPPELKQRLLKSHDSIASFLSGFPEVFTIDRMGQPPPSLDQAQAQPPPQRRQQQQRQQQLHHPMGGGAGQMGGIHPQQVAYLQAQQQQQQQQQQMAPGMGPPGMVPPGMSPPSFIQDANGYTYMAYGNAMPPAYWGAPQPHPQNNAGAWQQQQQQQHPASAHNAAGMMGMQGQGGGGAMPPSGQAMYGNPQQLRGLGGSDGPVQGVGGGSTAAPSEGGQLQGGGGADTTAASPNEQQQQQQQLAEDPASLGIMGCASQQQAGPSSPGPAQQRPLQQPMPVGGGSPLPSPAASFSPENPVLLWPVVTSKPILSQPDTDVAVPTTADLESLLSQALTAQTELRNADAIRLTKEVVEGRKLLFGETSAAYLAAMLVLSSLYSAVDELSQAEALAVTVVDSFKATLGPQHSNYLVSLNNLGALKMTQHKLQEAEELFKTASNGLRAQSDTGELLSGSAMTASLNLTLCLFRNAQLGKAEELSRNLLASTPSKAVGPSAAFRVTLQRNLALVYESAHRLEQAEQVYLQLRAEQWNIIQAGGNTDYRDTLLRMASLLMQQPDKTVQAQSLLDEAARCTTMR